MTGAQVRVEPWLRQMLRCPVTGRPLVDGTDPDGNPELVATGTEQVLAYPVRGGVPVLLEHEARRIR